MFTIKFSEPVPRGYPGAAVPAPLTVESDQLANAAEAVINHLRPHLTRHPAITAIEVHIHNISHHGWITHHGHAIGTFTATAVHGLAHPSGEEAVPA